MSGLPEGWAETTLGEIGRWSSGGTPLKNNSTYYEGEIPWVRTGDLRDNEISSVEGMISEEGLRNSSAKMFPEGTLLLAMYGATIGRTGILRIPAATNQACAALLPDGTTADLIPFIWWFLRASLERLRECGQGGAQPNISQTLIKEFPIYLPPLAEQRRIVAKLDRLFARTSRARAELGHIPQLIERYKQAILRKAFSGELTADWRAQAGQKETGRIATEISDPFTLRLEAPDSWQQWKFSDVCNIIGGSQPPKSNFTYCDGPGKVRLIQIRDYKTDDYVTFIPREMARRFCSKDDIMIGRYGPPIFQILHGLEGAYNVALMKAVPVEDRISKDYLYWYLHHPDLFNYVEVDSKRTSGQDGVNKRHLQRWPVLLPSLEEQGEIVLHIEKAMKWVDSLSSELGCALDLVDHLNEACLNRAFKGQLVTQDPNDEPASELLDRIRAERAARSNNGRNHRRK